MIELLEAIRVFKSALSGGDRKAIRVAAAGLICAIGDAWMSLEQKIPFGDVPSNDPDAEMDTVDALHDVIDDLGVEVPMEGAVGMSLLFSILVRLLVDQMKKDEIE